MAGGFELAKFFIKPVFDGKGVFAGLKKFDKQLKGLNKPIKQLNSSFNGLFKLAGIAGFAKMAFDAQKLGREIGLISDKTGIAASKLAKMQSAFSATGGDAKSLNSVIQNITSGLARLSMGDAEMASKLSAMGINAWEGGKVKTSDVVLGDIAEWTKGQLEAGRSMLEVSQFLQDNFGIQQDLTNQLALGREGFQQYQQAMAEKVGSLEDNEIDNLKSLNVALSRLKETVIVLADKIIAGLGPAIEFFVDLFQIAARNLQEVFDYLIQSFSDIVGNGDEVCQLFEFLKGVLTAFSLVLKGVVDVLKGFFQAVKMIGEVIGEVIFVFVQKIKNAIDSLKDSWLGRKLFGGDEKNEPQKGPKIEKLFPEKQKEEKLLITDEQGNVIDLDKVPFAPILIYDEQGNPVDLSKVPFRDTNSNVTIEQNMTINANGDVPAEEIASSVKEGASGAIPYLQNAASGEMSPAM